MERDSIVYQAAVWLQRLDAEEEGLVFGRLDFEDREVQYIGRLGVRDEEYELLTVDWRRAPACGRVLPGDAGGLGRSGAPPHDQEQGADGDPARRRPAGAG